MIGEIGMSRVLFWQAYLDNVFYFRAKSRFDAISKSMDPRFEWTREEILEVVKLDKETAGWAEIKYKGWRYTPIKESKENRGSF